MTFNDDVKGRINKVLKDSHANSDTCYYLFHKIDEPIALLDEYKKSAEKNGVETSLEEWNNYQKILREAQRVLNALAHIESEVSEDLRTLLKCESDPELAEECSDLFDIYEEIINP